MQSLCLAKSEESMTGKNQTLQPPVSSQATNKNATKGEGEETNLVAIGRKDLRLWNWHCYAMPNCMGSYMVDLYGKRWCIIYIRIYSGVGMRVLVKTRKKWLCTVSCLQEDIHRLLDPFGK